MRLLDEALLKRFAQIGRQDHVSDPLIIAEFFNPIGSGTWYATEYDPETRTFFGYTSIFGEHYGEWGYFSLDELESYKGTFGVGIERNRYWREQPASKMIPKFTGFSK